MTLTRTLVLSVLLALSACGKHPLHGGWHEQGAAHPRVLEFHPSTTEMLVHAHGQGGHEHLHGSYQLDGEKLVVRIQQKGKESVLEGKWSGDSMDLVDEAGATCRFVRGGAAH